MVCLMGGVAHRHSRESAVLWGPEQGETQDIHDWPLKK
jgi:hypothetical protein